MKKPEPTPESLEAFLEFRRLYESVTCPCTKALIDHVTNYIHDIRVHARAMKKKKERTACNALDDAGDGCYKMLMTYLREYETNMSESQHRQQN